MEKRDKLILWALAGINFTHIMDVMIMMPLGDIFMEEFDIGPDAFSLLLSSYAIGAFLSSVVGLFILDRFDRRQALLLLYAGFAIGTLLCGMASGFHFLLSVRFITGAFGGMIGALVLSIISDRFPFERRGNAMGVLMGAFSAAAALGVPFGLLLADLYSWHAPFLFLGGLGIVWWWFLRSAVPVMSAHLEDGVPPFSVKKIVGEISSDSNQLRALLLGFILIFGHYVIIPFITPYMVRNVGFTQTEVTYIYLIGGIMTVFSSPLIGKMTDRFGVMRVFTVTLFVSFIPVLLMTQLPPVPVALALVVTTAFFALGSGRMIAPQTMITAAVGPSNRGSFMSAKSALQQLAIAVAAFVSGQMVAEAPDGRLLHYGWVGYLSVAVCLLALYLAGRLKVAEGN